MAVKHLSLDPCPSSCFESILDSVAIILPLVQLISVFYAPRVDGNLFFLNLKFQASNYITKCLYSLLELDPELHFSLKVKKDLA